MEYYQTQQGNSTQKNSEPLTLSELKEKGYRLKYPVPMNSTCNFCQKESEPRGLAFNDSIIFWMQPERCTCEKSIEYWNKYDKEKAEQEAREIEEQRKYELSRKVERLFAQSKLGERFKTRTFENFKVDADNKRAYDSASKYAHNFTEYRKQGIGIMLNGNFGTGKTHLAAAITLYLLNNGTPVIFGTLINLLGKIKQSYTDNESEENIIDTYCTVDLLIIDDLGKEKPTEWVLEKLYNIVNTRYENNKPIIITTNYNYDELIKRLTVNGNDSTAHALSSRLNEMCRGILVGGQDHRMI